MATTLSLILSNEGKRVEKAIENSHRGGIPKSMTNETAVNHALWLLANIPGIYCATFATESTGLIPIRTLPQGGEYADFQKVNLPWEKDLKKWSKALKEAFPEIKQPLYHTKYLVEYLEEAAPIVEVKKVLVRKPVRKPVAPAT